MNFLQKIKDFLKTKSFIYSTYKDIKLKLSADEDSKFKYSRFPWDISFEERQKKLQEQKEQVKILFLVEKPDIGTFRYRAYNICQVLNNKIPGFWGMYFFQNEFEMLLENFDFQNVKRIVLVRIGWSKNLQKIISIAKRKKIEIVYDTDDLIFDVNIVPELVEQIGADDEQIGYYFYYVASRLNIANQCTKFITTNGYLASIIEETFERKVSIFPNTLNKEQLELTECLNEYGETKNQKDEFVIGYFSGTKTHQKDFKIVELALKKIMENNKMVKLIIVGYLDVPKSLKGLENRIEKLGLLNFLDQLRVLKECDVNIVPLDVNKFTNCKSELKFFEAGIVKVPTIASPTYAYKSAIKEGVNGFLAEDKNDDWYLSLEKLIKLKSLKQETANKAFSKSKSYYYNYNNKIKIEEIYCK